MTELNSKADNIQKPVDTMFAEAGNSNSEIVQA